MGPAVTQVLKIRDWVLNIPDRSARDLGSGFIGSGFIDFHRCEECRATGWRRVQDATLETGVSG